MKKILIVEDEKNIRYLYDEELSAEGYIVTTVQDGPKALRMLSSEKFDLLILDEPTSWLDVKRCTFLAEILRNLAENIQVILISHNQALKENISNLQQFAVEDFLK